KLYHSYPFHGQRKQYRPSVFQKKFEDVIILVKVNPIQFKGVEITLLPNGECKMRALEFDQGIMEDLATDGFEQASALEFNLYYSGLAK
ncbi:MAG TPA: hypothetical protein VEW65_11100, partial [Chryseolinea sp.]|nr:hypothetical protein [Chryseolinea sp.]